MRGRVAHQSQSVRRHASTLHSGPSSAYPRIKQHALPFSARAVFGYGEPWLDEKLALVWRETGPGQDRECHIEQRNGGSSTKIAPVDVRHRAPIPCPRAHMGSGPRRDLVAHLGELRVATSSRDDPAGDASRKGESIVIRHRSV